MCVCVCVRAGGEEGGEEEEEEEHFHIGLNQPTGWRNRINPSELRTCASGW